MESESTLFSVIKFKTDIVREILRWSEEGIVLEKEFYLEKWGLKIL